MGVNKVGLQAVLLLMLVLWRGVGEHVTRNSRLLCRGNRRC